MTESQFPHATQQSSEEDSMSSKQEPAVVTDENVEQQFLWLTNTAGNQLAELVGGVSSTSQLDQRAVDQLRSIAEVAGKLADRYEKDAVPAPVGEQNFGLVAPLKDEEKSEEDQKALKEVQKAQQKQSDEDRKNADPAATVPESKGQSQSDVKPRQQDLK